MFCLFRARVGLPTIAACALAAVPIQAAEPPGLSSPGGKLAVSVGITAEGEPWYRVDYANKTVLAESHLGLELEGAQPLSQGLAIESVAHSSHDQTWQPVYGERSRIRDHYNQLVVTLREPQQPARQFQVVVRAYDEGVAFCYKIPPQPGPAQWTIRRELTQFRFTGNHRAWPVYSAQGEYHAARLADIKPNCERPLVVELDSGPVVAIGEARLVDFARMRLRPAEGIPFSLESHLAGPVTVTTPYTTPWRVILVGDRPGDLLEHNYLLLNLNDPCAIEDTSWIQPGKVIREVTLTTQGGKACVDFAVRMGIRYVEYDAGWYGHEYDEQSDATTVTRDPDKSGVQGGLDLPEVIRYAAEHGIGIILYVNRRQLERQLDEILPLYRQWGVKGVKYGFVQVGSQPWTTWLHAAIRKAADQQLMVDVHDEYRPTGYERTYPNLMTVEGVRGNECMPPAEQNLILPLTRLLCGPADCTICWYSDRIKNTLAHQLATSVVFYSPWQFVFWYDRPHQYRGEPALDFLKQVPVVWDETRVLSGTIGQQIVVARRQGNDWFVGVLNAGQRRRISVSLEFLSPARSYTAEIYADGVPDGGTPHAIDLRCATVTRESVLDADVAANGGQAIRLVPVP